MCTRVSSTPSPSAGTMDVHSPVCVKTPGLESTDVLKSKAIQKVHVNSEIIDINTDFHISVGRMMRYSVDKDI